MTCAPPGWLGVAFGMRKMDKKGFLQHGVFLGVVVLAAGCQAQVVSEKPPYPTFGSIERKDPRFDGLVPKEAKLERLASGFDWSEGPVCSKEGGYLLFSDIPPSTVYKWKEGEGITVFLKPSGYTGSKPRGGEPGSNGLLFDAQGRLVLCEHGDRRVARLEKDGKKTTLAERFQGKRLNSPNDAVFRSNGDLYFTDPPYGLVGRARDPEKEIDFNGVFRVSRSGEVTLLTREVSYPNGIAFSPDEKTLYVACSDRAKPVWCAFDIREDGAIANSRIFFDATEWTKAAKRGGCDGLKVDKDGNVFATGPGGVHVFTPKGEHLGTIVTGEATANVAWGNDGSVLYITADMHLARIKTATRGKGF